MFSCRHGVEMDQDKSTTGDWYDAMGSNIGSMGGESNKSIVRVFVIVEGTAKEYMLWPGRLEWF
jgi:hypothetical protein